MFKSHDETDEAVQDFVVQFLERGFGQYDPTRGRFRDYLKASLRNAVISRHRRSQPQLLESGDWDTLAAADLSDDIWLGNWRT